MRTVSIRCTEAAWKVSKCGVFCGSYFPGFGLNAQRYGVFSSNAEKYGPEKTLHWDTFHTVRVNPDVNVWKKNHIFSSENSWITIHPLSASVAFLQKPVNWFAQSLDQSMTGFYMRATLALNGLIRRWNHTFKVHTIKSKQFCQSCGDRIWISTFRQLIPKTGLLQ